MKCLTDVTEDGSMCAVISDTSLKVYNVMKRSLIFSSKKSKFLPIQPKVVKISPCKQVVACLQVVASPHHLTLFFMKSQSSEEIKPANEYLFENILFSPDGQYLTAFSNLSIFTDIYVLKGGTVSLVATINGATINHFGSPMAAFSYDGDYFLSVDICKQAHLIRIYTAEDSSWDCVKSIAVSPCSGVVWCRDSASMLMWSLRFSSLQLVTLDGRVERSLSSLTPVSTLALSTCGRLAAIYYINNKIEILDLLTWQLVSTRKIIHCPVVHESLARFRLREHGDDSEAFTTCETVTTSLELGYDESREKCQPKVAFSYDSKLLASHAPPYPGVLWVWDLTADLVLHTVVLLKPGTIIQDIVWHNELIHLAAALSKNRLLLWTNEEVKILNTSENPWPLLPKSYFVSVGEVSL